MNLAEITCCHGGPHTVECNYCSHSPRYVGRREIEIEHKRQLARSVTFPAGESVERALDGGSDNATALSAHHVVDEPPAPAEQTSSDFERTAKRLLAEGATTALLMVEWGLADGLNPADAIALARHNLRVWDAS